ncbi:MAG: 5-methyltetrahydropteroyltriglutamate--homocysteine S-methyltransferase [Alphaproteobacteria bacterium]|jgi:5-methyltetrahydropteroyltriglutamate--homocysteine methyltransferase|nr:5-methyltetrahydropteroyltriglutamate--homocysteine S-methyltransferase [Alphaproteobacteria bacterium]QQS57688.1 MAG: 5-methyltetrahydropteroyltriglutamate--homocysteine S-methyltransferase [Alphaproteobacteria bacterium]
MVLATNLGFPRIGDMRQLKKAVEDYWKGNSSQEALLATGKSLRAHNWKLQKDAGIEHIPSNDFSFYDQILDLICTLGAIPERYKWDGKNVDLDTYFAMARGRQQGGVDVTAMEMTKWFDTNYHYMVPEFTEKTSFKLSSTKIFDQYKEAKDQGIETRPVIVGPITFVRIGKKQAGFDACRCTLVPKLVPVYVEILKKLKDLGAQWVQIDEPAMVLDLEPQYRDAFKAAYKEIREAVPGLKIIVTSYFDTLRDNADTFFSAPVDAFHIDLCRGPGQANTGANNAEKDLDAALAKIPSGKILSVGVVDGRNIWKNDLSKSLKLVEKAVAKLGKDNVFVAGSSSLIHTPVDLNSEKEMDKQIRSWLAYATQKLSEIATIAKGANQGKDAIAAEIKASDAVQEDRRTSTRIHDQKVKKRVEGITPDMKQRKSPFAKRQQVQHKALNLPLYPTTSIGSFPQTPEIRKARADHKAGTINDAKYKEAMQAEIRSVVEFQHEIGIDVLVHGEPERNDMVEYFGEQLAGFTFSKFGWVQSYGSRCVKPPIIFGDVSRPNPMTVEWSKYAQDQTQKIMKGMLTGPITILQWSFVRDDQPRSLTSKQIALAIRDEVSDLEKAGIRMIQIDEAAFREGLPLRKADWKAYLDNAVEDFRITACCVEDETQIHTHMCYSEFNDVIDSIGAMDADVISIETSRSQMELLDAFAQYKYPNEIGPGVYDIHSPRVPSTKEMVDLLEKAKKVLDERQIWVNPDCGLKTRGWPEVKQALKNMVVAADEMRAKAKSKAA